jgi:hypothetical protein
MSAAAGFRARLYRRGGRIPAALLVALSRASLPAVLALVALATDPPIDLPLLLELLLVLAVVPALLARVMRRRAHLELGASALILRRTDLVVEVPYAAIARVAPWALPLPGPGLTLWLRSGARLAYAVETADPGALLRALTPAVGDAARSALAHPMVTYAHAAAGSTWRWYHYGWKFVLFALAPTAVFFNAHQHIAYGGPLGEYYLYGAGAYLRTFAVYWLTMAIYLVLFASPWRGLAEAVAWAMAWGAPERAATVRRAVERGCQILYYGGVPVLVAARFLS